MTVTVAAPVAELDDLLSARIDDDHQPLLVLAELSFVVAEFVVE